MDGSKVKAEKKQIDILLGEIKYIVCLFSKLPVRLCVFIN